MGSKLADEKNSGSVFHHLEELKKLATQAPSNGVETDELSESKNKTDMDDLMVSGSSLAITGDQISKEQFENFTDEFDANVDEVETARLKYLSEHDELTGQKNRIKLHEALEEQIQWSRKNNLFSGFVIAGIDNLSVINDTFGYQLGDEVIAAVAYELAKALRKHDVIGRYSANKIGLILPRCGPDALNSTSARLLQHIADQRIETSKGIIPLTISIGGVVMPQHAKNAQEAVSRSLEALDIAKRNSSNSYIIYELSSEREIKRKRNLQIADEIISALNDHRMHLSLQPIVSAKTREVVHSECLLVMECQNGEMVSAGEFMPVAEKLGLCRLIDYRTLELATDLLKKEEDLKLALNVSSITTRDPNWLIVMRARARRDRAVMERLMVEITETESISDLEETASFVSSLRELGCKVAIDDFGAGYSSYKYLRSLEVDVVKIDGEYIREITTSADDKIFVGSLIDLAKSFNLETVAEWVINDETADYLTKAGVDYLQGFGIGKPQIIKQDKLNHDEIESEDVEQTNASEVS